MNESKNIAIVDDHTMFRKGLCALINLFPNYTVILDAANGNDFIRQLQPARLPDIVLLDIAMPEMDGYGLAGWISANYPAIKILALSTMESEKAILRMIRSGARGYLLKDAEPAELKQAFDAVISEGYYYNEQVSPDALRSIGSGSGSGLGQGSGSGLDSDSGPGSGPGLPAESGDNSFSVGSRSSSGGSTNSGGAGAFPSLSGRELTFLKLACTEKTYYEIAKEMFVSERTVDGYRDSLFRKLQISTRVGLVLYAIRNGIVFL